MCLLAWDGTLSLPASPQPDYFRLRYREMKGFTQHFVSSGGQRQNLNPHPRTRLFLLPYSGSIEDCQLAHSIHSFIHSLKYLMSVDHVCGAVLAMRIQQ